MAQNTKKKKLRQFENIKDVLAVKLWLPKKLANLVHSIVNKKMLIFV